MVLGLQMVLGCVATFLALRVRHFPRQWCLIAVTVIGVGCVFLTGFDGFVLFDHSIIFDGAWRVAKGDIPYRDFWFPTGALVFLFQGLIFRLCGVSMVSLVLGAGLLSAAGGLLTFESVRLVSRSHAVAFSAALVTIACSVFQLSVPWHADIAYVCVFVAVYCAIRAGVSRQPTWFAGAGVFSLLAALGKQNVGFASTLILGLLALGVPLRGRRLAAFLLGTGVTVVLVGLWLVSCGTLDRFVYHFFVAPLQIGRLPRVLDVAWFNRSSWVPLAIVLFVAGRLLWRLIRTPGRVDRTVAQMGVGLALLQWMTVRTSAAQVFHLSGLLLGLLCAAEGVTLQRLASRTRQRGLWLERLMVVVLTCALSYFLVFGTTRRIFHYAFAPWGARDYALQEPGLRPLRMDRIHGPALDGVIRYLKTQIPPAEPVVVFPNAMLLYGVTGRRSPVPLLWFDRGVSYVPGDGTDELLCNVLEDAQVRWIVLENVPQLAGRAASDHLQWLPKFRAFLATHYTIHDAGLAHYTVLVRHQEVRRFP